MWYVTVKFPGSGDIYYAYQQLDKNMPFYGHWMLEKNVLYAEAYNVKEIENVKRVYIAGYHGQATINQIECSSRRLIPENLQWFLEGTKHG